MEGIGCSCAASPEMALRAVGLDLRCPAGGPVLAEQASLSARSANRPRTAAAGRAFPRTIDVRSATPVELLMDFRTWPVEKPQRTNTRQWVPAGPAPSSSPRTRRTWLCRWPRRPSPCAPEPSWYDQACPPEASHRFNGRANRWRYDDETRRSRSNQRRASGSTRWRVSRMRYRPRGRPGAQAYRYRHVLGSRNQPDLQARCSRKRSGGRCCRQQQ